jgi:ribonucleoside-diphosphate reductase alpha chain
MMVMKHGGGIGIDYSNLRPKDDPIESTGGTSSGVVAFMEMFNQGVETIKAGGRRRGASIGSLDISHPDIEDFISSKLDEGKLTNMNISVRITNDFMRAVEEDKDWNLVFNGKVYKTIKARELFKKIVHGAWKYGDPGILFVDEIKRNEPYKGDKYKIGQNPCVTGDTLILTNEGYKRIDECVDKVTTIWNGFEWSVVTPCVTGYDQEIMEVTFSDGNKVKCTPYHKFILHAGYHKNRTVKTTIKEAKELIIDDKIIKCDYPIIEGEKELENAYTHGFYSGDGYYVTREKQNMIDVYGEKKKLIKYLKYRKAYVFTKSSERIRLTLDGTTDWDKSFVPDCSYTIKTRLEWLAGIIDSDGSNQNKSIAISSIDKEFLLKIKHMLNTLGLNVTIGLMKSATQKMMPDGNGGLKEYKCLDCYNLCIAGSDVVILKNLGLKTYRVSIIATTEIKSKKFNKIISIVRNNEIADKVYCFNEPKNHTGIFNGVILGQCGETNLLTCSNGGESCNLGSINLSNLCGATPNDYENITKQATYFLNSVIDKNFYPVPEIEDMTKGFRRIGIGVMGFADLLIKTGLPYDSPGALQLAENIMFVINAASIKTSVKLAEVYGTFPKFDECEIETPRYNYSTTVIAPTGTISLLAGCSSGIEPIFSLVHKRYTWADGEKVGYLQVHPIFEEKLTEYLESHYGVYDWDKMKKSVLEHAYAKGTIQDIEWLPKDFRELFKTSLDISPKAHIDMQAAFQKYTGNNISKTINLPNNTTEEEVWDIYFYGWKKHLKGMTVYRSGSRDIEVLELKKESTSTPVTTLPDGRILPKRPVDLPATNSKRRSGCGKLIISVAEKDGSPYECIINNKGGCTAMNDALGQMISLSMRWNVPTWDIIKTLRNVTCPVAYKKFAEGKSDGKSCSDVIGRVIESLIPDKESESTPIPCKVKVTTEHNICPECGERMSMVEGCVTCACGYSRCG